MQFPNASIMNTLAPPDQEIMDSPLQYLQIVKVRLPFYFILFILDLTCDDKEDDLF